MIVVLFSTKRNPDRSEDEYRETNGRMGRLVEGIPGFLSSTSYTAEDGESVTVVRFESEEALRAWGAHPEHRASQRRGREAFYDEYWIQVCATTREGWFRRGEPYREDLRELFAPPVAAT
jgi:heme-degrading monooxygenase HmoA